jgi:hypothetical protein
VTSKKKVSLALAALTALALGAACAPPEEASPELPQMVEKITSELNTTLKNASFSDANVWDQVQYYSTIRFPDLNGDGRTDVCGRGIGGVICALDDGTGRLANETVWNSSFSDANSWNQAQYYGTIQFPDVNGDGRADVCGRGALGVYCALSNGSSFGSAVLWNGDFSDANSWNQPQYYRTIQFPDINGDGKADLCGRGTLGVYCALSNGSSFGAITLVNTNLSDANLWNQVQYYSTIKYPDVDGDGKADLCARGVLGVSCALSTGTSFGTMTLWNNNFSDANGWNQAQYYSTIQFSDLNNDKKMDLCGRGGAGIYCGLSTGAAFNGPTVWDASFSDANGWNAAKYYATIHMVRDVLCGRGAAGLYCSFSDRKSKLRGAYLQSSNESDANGWTQPQYYSTISLTSDLKLSERGAAGIYATTADRDELAIGSVTDLDNKRMALINKVWSRSTIDTTQQVDFHGPPEAIDVTPLPANVTVERYKIRMPTSGGSPRGDGNTYVEGIADHFFPAGGASKLVILNPGHACRYTQTPYQDAQTVIELLNDGYAVLATYMPRGTPLDCASDMTVQHNRLFDPSGNLRPANGGHPLIYFLDPVRRSLNYVLAHFNYSQVHMAGLSGGGWTTTLYAALDTRIAISIPIAGSEPFYMRFPSDAEQEDNVPAGNDFFHFMSGGTPVVTGYKDLYLMGGYGAGRRQIQVLNRNDDCCFGQGEYVGSSVPWDRDVRAYEGDVRSRVKALGAGSFRVEINEADDKAFGAFFTHEFSKNTRVNVMLAELDGASPFLGAANGALPFARGMNGHLYQGKGAGSWTDTNLAMVGTPAILKGAVNALDVFYRDPFGNIVHAVFNGSSWSATGDITGVISGDPSAVSWGSGRIDVVAVGGDYKLHHWAYNGSWTADVIDTGGTFAVGRVALTSWGANRLDVFFRGHDALLYHVSSNGSAPYTVEPAKHSLKGFPTATSKTGTLWPFVIGTNNAVYQGQSTMPGSWAWTNLSSATGSSGTPALGSPGVFRSSGGSIQLYARSTANQLGLFSLVPPSTTWHFAAKPGVTVLGSPAAADLGAFVLDTGRAADQLDATGWHALGGVFDR